jgi:dimethylamine monooxygenase subunit A
MLPYLPFERATHAMAMGTRALGDRPFLEVDPARYLGEMALKEALLADDHAAHARALPGSAAAQWETVEQVLPRLARDASAAFSLAVEGERWQWTNHRRGETTTFRLGEPGDLPWAPLDWLGRQVQEDLLLLDGAAPGTPLIAGHLCFPAGWCLADTLGRSFLTIHDPVPGFRAEIGRSADLLMQRLKPGHPVERVNWSITVTDQLDLAPWTRPRWEHLRAGITPANAGERCYLRVERQTLLRLPRTRAILFAIHTYRAPVATLLGAPEQARRLAGVLRTLPPATRAYKHLDGLIEPLLRWLAARGVAEPS